MGQSIGKFLYFESSILFTRREAGVILITLYHYGVAGIVKRTKLSIPPVLASIIGILVSLGLIKKLKGKEYTDEIIYYFDPSVQWLGDWMPLWLAPPLVVLPNALLSVSGTNAKIWFKLVLAHILCWVITVTGTSKLFRIYNRMGNSIAITHPSASHLEERKHGTPGAVALKSNYEKSLRLLKFWGAVTVAFYGGTVLKVLPSAPALATTSICAMTAGTMIPLHIRKIIHPIFVTAAASGVAAILLESIKKDPAPWKNALCGYFSNGRDKNWTPGDVFFAMLGPSCSALAFRMFAQAPSMQKDLTAIIATSATVAVLSLVGSPLLGKAFQLPEELSAALAHVSIECDDGHLQSFFLCDRSICV